MSDGRDEAGSATLLVVAMAGVLMVLGAAFAVVTAMAVAHRAAQSAADLAALAGARGAAAGGDGCTLATQIAAANGAPRHAVRRHGPGRRHRCPGPRATLARPDL